MAYALFIDQGVCLRPYPNQVILPQRAFKRGLERSLPQPLDLYITKGEAHPRPCQMTRPPRSDRLASALAYAIRPLHRPGRMPYAPTKKDNPKMAKG